MNVLSLIVLIAWFLALVRTIINLLAVPRLALPRPRDPDEPLPLVSVIVPARDEEREIERTVRALLAQSWPALEVIVVDDRSTDSTGEILASIAREEERLIVLHGEEPPPGWLGKPAALHRGSQHARGELLLFVDADVIYEPDAVAAAVGYLEESGVPMITLFPRMEMRGFWENVVMPNLAVFAFSMLPLWLTNRSRIPLLGVGGGPGNLVRRAEYHAVGGHVALKDAVIDDVGLSRLFRRHGHRTHVVRASAFVSVRMYWGLGEVVRGFTKNAFPVLGRNYLAAALFAVGAVVFHLLPWGWALAGDEVALATLGLIAITRLVLFGTLGYGLINALFGHPLMIAAWLVIMMRSVWFTGIRRQLHWRGRTYDSHGTRFGAD